MTVELTTTSKALANERMLRLLDSSECLIVCYLNVIFPLTAPLSRMIYVSRHRTRQCSSLSMKIALAKKLFSSHHHHRHRDNCRRCQPFVYSSNEAQELWMCTTQFVISGTGDDEEEEEECGMGREKWLVDSTLNSINLIRFISTHISSISFNNSESIIHSSRRFSRSLVGWLFFALLSTWFHCGILCSTHTLHGARIMAHNNFSTFYRALNFDFCIIHDDVECSAARDREKRKKCSRKRANLRKVAGKMKI